MAGLVAVGPRPISMARSIHLVPRVSRSMHPRAGPEGDVEPEQARERALVHGLLQAQARGMVQRDPKATAPAQASCGRPSDDDEEPAGGGAVACGTAGWARLRQKMVVTPAMAASLWGLHLIDKV
jgi:hypothetical protein